MDLESFIMGIVRPDNEFPYLEPVTLPPAPLDTHSSPAFTPGRKIPDAKTL
jgi:hypothetical protein